MTKVTIDLRVPSPDGSYVSAVGRTKWVPSRRANVNDGTTNYVVLPKPFSVWLTSPAPTVDVPPNGPDWCWKVYEYTTAGEVRYVTVPETDVTQDYMSLADVDPTTLLPTSEPEAAWWSLVNGWTGLSIGTVATLPAGSPATADVTGPIGSQTLNLGIPEGGGGGAVDSVNGQVGVVSLTPADVGAVDPTRKINGHDLTADVTVTKSDVGLPLVDNTADVDKPVSTATANALAAKANLASPTFTGTVGGITKSMVGLDSVDNTADTAKPVSTAQQYAIDQAAATRIQVLYWDSTTSSWPTIPAHTVPLYLVSTHDAAATAPTGPNLIAGDVWKQRLA